MEGSARYELASGSPDSSFSAFNQNGQRGYSGPALGRSSSFRECSETRKLGSAKLTSRATANSSRDVSILSQCLMLEPISIGDSKLIRPNDLKRVFGSSTGNNSEDNSYGSRNSPPMVVEELKRFRANVADTCVKASGRAKILDERLSKLNKYFETLPKKQQLRGDILANERSNGSILKIGSQTLRNPPEANPKFDNRTRNIGLSKRVRTSMTENRGECRNASMLRQPSMVSKDREMVKDNNVDSDVGEEKLRRLPAGGEGWDKNMKRKRSVGSVFSRSVDNDSEMKRAVHSKPSSESSLQSSDSTHIFRSVPSGGNKLEPLAPPGGSTTRVTFKSDQEKPIVPRDLSSGQIKERAIGKVNVKLNREESHAMCPTPLVKGKASRGPRSGTVMNSSSNVPRLSGTLESWEQPQAMMKASPVSGVSNRKRGMNAGSPSPPFTPWGSQRPQKMSRTRRTNLGPVLNHDELPMQSDGCFTSDFGPRISIGVGSNTSIFPKSGDANQVLKIKSENVPSPARHSESDESGAGENRNLDKGFGGRDLEERIPNPSQCIAPASVSIRQNAAMMKEEVGDGVKRQGRSGRISPFSRSRISPKPEKLDSVTSTKPLRNVKSGPDKAGSKSGRPLKKLSDRKGFAHLSHVANGGSPDYTGEFDDDREELLVAANRACSSSITACSSKFWKSVDPLFCPLRPDDKSFLSEQMKLPEQSDACSFQKHDNTDSVDMNLVDCGLEELTASNSTRRNRYMVNESEVKNSSRQMDSLNGCSPVEKRYDVVAPLYQRVLSALILEDEIEECEETGFGRPRSLTDDPNLFSSGDGSCVDGPEFLEDNSGIQSWMNGHARKVFPVAPANICNGELKEGDGKFVRTGVEMLARLYQCDYIPQNLVERNGGFGFEYDHMRIEEKLIHELHSIGLSVENVPPLDDNEEDEISQEISQLGRLLHGQIGKKKAYLGKISSAVQQGKDLERDPEQIAMDKLVELTYKKLLSTKGSLAAKYGVAKVKKPLALSFARRTLTRCIKYEESGTSCFSEPPLREIVYALPPHFTDSELLSGVDSTSVNDCGSMDVLQKNGSTMLSRGKKREVLLDNVGGGGVSRVTAALGIVGAKGKRSERDASNKNGIMNPGHAPVGGSKGERKAKAKPKQRTAQLSASGGAFLPKFADATTNSLYSSGSGSGESGNNGGSKRKDIRFMSASNPPSVSSQEVKETVKFSDLPIPELDGMAELGVDTEIDATQDLTSWFNFDVDMPHDHDAVGLEVPMDDLSELNMF